VQTLILPVRHVVPATPRTRIITIDLDGHPFVYRAGQAVFASLAEGAVRRPYSIACSPAQASRDRAIELLVQIDDHDPPDPHLERANAGTLLRIEGPFGSLGLPGVMDERRLLLVAGGTGIAPLRSILWDVLERDDGVAVNVIYSARSADEFAYLEELGTLEAERRIALSLTVTREDKGAWTGTRGRIDRALITAALTSVETRCLICGPAPLVADVSSLLSDAGVMPERIVTETYTA
jgi:ferredoxin-NADP reductase